MFAPCFVVQCLVTFMQFCNHLADEERAGYLTCIVFLMSCGCLCSLTISRCRGLDFTVPLRVAFPSHAHLLFVQ